MLSCWLVCFHCVKLVTYYAAVLLVAVIVLKGPTWAFSEPYTQMPYVHDKYKIPHFSIGCTHECCSERQHTACRAGTVPLVQAQVSFKIGTKPLVVGQKLRICGKPWWQAKGHLMPSTLLIFCLWDCVYFGSWIWTQLKSCTFNQGQGYPWHTGSHWGQ
jgi:hypothetical protein